MESTQNQPASPKSLSEVTTSARSTSALFVIGMPKSTTRGTPAPMLLDLGHTSTVKDCSARSILKFVRPTTLFWLSVTVTHRRRAGGKVSVTHMRALLVSRTATVKDGSFLSTMAIVEPSGTFRIFSTVPGFSVMTLEPLGLASTRSPTSKTTGLVGFGGAGGSILNSTGTDAAPTPSAVTARSATE